MWAARCRAAATIGVMSARREPPRLVSVLPVGDPRRQAIGRAVFGTLFACVVFFVFAAPAKQIGSVYDHAAWANDPYDTVYSFAMFFVPLVAALFLVQVSLCRRSEPLSIARVLVILRGCRLALGAVLTTLLSCWVSVALGANRSQWTSGATLALLALLVVATLVAARASRNLGRVPKLRSLAGQEGGARSDWLTDAVAVAERESRRLGPLQAPVLRVLTWIDRQVFSEVRRHAVLGAAAVAAVFGGTVGSNQGICEGYTLAATLLTVGLLVCGMFAFLLMGGSYVRLVQSQAPLRGTRRRVLDAGVGACVAAVAALAFRDSLWRVMGTNASLAGAAQLAALVGLAMATAFVAVLGCESLRRAHSQR